MPERALLALQGPKAVDALKRLVPGVEKLVFMTGGAFDWNGTDLFVPLKAGVKYYFGQDFYLEGEGGAALSLNHGRNSLGLFSIGPGFVIPSEKHGVDISFRYEDWQGQLKQTAIRVAYRFGL